MLTTHNRHSPHNWEKFQQRLQTQFSEERKLISTIFIAFLKSSWNFVYLEKKDQFRNLSISEDIDSEKCSYFNAKKQMFQKTFWESTSSRIPNNAQICMAAVLF